MTNEEVYKINKQMKAQGYTEKEIAERLGLLVSTLRRIISDVNHEIRVNKMIRALELKEQGYGSSAIGREMGINESSVRRLLEESNKLEYHREIETERIYRMLDEGYDCSYIACKLGCDENHVKWIICDEETITPAILEIVEELLSLNSLTRQCTNIQIGYELLHYYYDSYNITDELIDYIVKTNGYGITRDTRNNAFVYFKNEFAQISR